MLVIGLTGGIGSGKSAAAARFAAHGAPVIDADVVAREVVEPGSPGLKQVVASFGQEMLDRNGRLDRNRLRQSIFADREKRQRLEDILHPIIRAEMIRRVEALDAPYCILVVPLLLETDFKVLVDRILVVDAPEPLQITRVMQRNHLPETEIRSIIQTQLSREQRLAAADDILTNDADLENLHQQIDTLHQRYLMLAAEHG